MSHLPPRQKPSALARGFAAVAALYAMGITIILWGFTAGVQPIWPLPGLYLLEFAALPLWIALVVWQGAPGPAKFAALASGAAAAFGGLGIFSIGFYYFPLSLLLGAAAIATREKAGASWKQLAGFFVAGAAAQAALMFLLMAVS